MASFTPDLYNDNYVEFFNSLEKPEVSLKLHINACQSLAPILVKLGVTRQGGATPKWIKLDLAIANVPILMEESILYC